MAWDKKATEILGEEITDILADNDICVYDVTKVHENSFYFGLEFYSDAGEDFCFDVQCEGKEEFVDAFKEFANNFDVNEHAEIWIENRGVKGVPQEISTLLEDAKSIKETLDNVACELAGEKLSRDCLTVQVTFDNEELKKLAYLAGVETSALDGEGIINALHTMIEHTEIPAYTKEELDKWGKEQLSNLTYGTMSLEISSVSYDDVISSETILSAFCEYQNLPKKDMSFKDFLYQQVDEAWGWVSIDEAEQQLFSEIEALAEKESEEFQKAFHQIYCLQGAPNIYECLDDWGFIGSTIDLDSYLRGNYYINLMFATGQEQDFDMSALTSFTPCLSDVTDSFLNDDKEFAATADNALSYLIHQQGHTISELYESLYEKGISEKQEDEKGFTETEGKNTEFIKSVANEINDNYYGGMSELTALASTSGNELIELLDNIANGRDYIVLPKETEIGLFNEWSGAGAPLEIALERPAVFPANMIRNVQFESTRDNYVKSNNGYTVNDVYGLTMDAWKKGVTVTNEAPQLREENLKDVQEQLKNYVAKENIKEKCERE